jgi:hypothetical protein
MVGGKEYLFQPSDGNPKNPKGVPGVYALRSYRKPHPASSKSDESPRIDARLEHATVAVRGPVLVNKMKTTVPYIDMDDESAKALLEGKLLRVHAGKATDPDTGEPRNALVAMAKIENALEANLADREREIQERELELQKLEATIESRRRVLAEPEPAKKAEPGTAKAAPKK